MIRIRDFVQKVFPFFYLLPALTHAAPGTGGQEGLPTIIDILCRIMNWMFAAAIVISVIFVLWSALLFITSGGSDEKVSEARKTAMYAIIGFVVAVLARSVPAVMGSLLGASAPDQC